VSGWKRHQEREAAGEMKLQGQRAKMEGKDGAEISTLGR
jgi:hypothetical protein